MQQKLLKTLVEEMASLEAGPVVDILFSKKDVNEFLIAKKMEMTINQIRNILYKLSAEGLVSFIRKKDKRKGWYIYYWTLNTEKCLVKIEQSLIKKIDNLKDTLKLREFERFYVCKPCGVEVNEMNALEHVFTCEECFGVYELADNEKPVRDLRMEISRRQRELKIIDEELIGIRKKTQKKRTRREAREKVNAKIKRAKKAKERKDAKAKEGKNVKGKGESKEKKAKVKKKIGKLVRKVRKAIGKGRVKKKIKKGSQKR